ncbi:hypothetical protein bcgnr5390_30440 [Bacillus luti]
MQNKHRNYICLLAIVKNKKKSLYVYNNVGDINGKTNTCKYSYKHYIVVYSDSLRSNAFSI